MTKILKNKTISVKTPIGTVYVVVGEDHEGQPIQIQIFGGKAGTEFFASCAAIASLCTELLSLDGGMEKILAHLKDLTANRSVLDRSTQVRSGIEGIYIALYRYQYWLTTHPTFPYEPPKNIS